MIKITTQPITLNDAGIDIAFEFVVQNTSYFIKKAIWVYTEISKNVLKTAHT